jgi:uncharacterized protein
MFMDKIIYSNTLPGIVVGNPVTGEDFFDREQELREFTELIESGANVMVSAPRRIGKTSLLMEAGNRLSDRYAILFADVQACTTETDAILKLAMVAREHRDIGQKMYDIFRNVFGSVFSRIGELSVAEISAKFREGIVPDWQARADEILERLASVEKGVVLFIDELPVLISALFDGEDHRMTPEGIRKARVFLSWLREATIRYRGRIRFVVSGSIGLEPLLSRAGISGTMTTFTPFALGSWDRPTASSYLEDRARRNSISFIAGATELLLDKLGDFIPHHVAMFMHFIRNDVRRRDSAICSREDIERIYDQQMLSVHGHVDLATYEDRLKCVVGDETLRIALELLTEAAVFGRLSQPAAMKILGGHGLLESRAAETLRFLLNVFIHDGYLRLSGEAYVFKSFLLRDWWRNRFGFGYVPAEKR